jgi:hypothetical protein
MHGGARVACVVGVPYAVQTEVQTTYTQRTQAGIPRILEPTRPVEEVNPSNKEMNDRLQKHNQADDTYAVGFNKVET